MQNSAEIPTFRLLLLVFALLFAACAERGTDSTSPMLILPTAPPVAVTVEEPIVLEESKAIEEVAEEPVESIAEKSAEPVVEEPAEPISRLESTINRLVVVNSGSQLFTVDPDGENMVRLTDDDLFYGFPAWSPDSISIAAIGGGTEPASNGIWVFEDSAETAPTRVHAQDNRPIYLSWSPSGDEIAFITPRGGRTTLIDLRVVPGDGTDTSRFLAFGQPFYWDWNSTGDEMVINTQRTSHADFALVDPSAGDVGDQLAEASVFFQSPDISADDQWLAYGTGDRTERQITIENRVTGNSNSVPHNGVVAFAWSPAANQLAYVAAAGNFGIPWGPLRLLDTDGTVRQLTDNNILSFFWTPDGSQIVYLVVNGLLEEEPNAAQSRTIRARPRAQERGSDLDFSLRVVNVETGDERQLGTFELSPLFVQQFIPYADQYTRSHSLIAPDSSAIALPIYEFGRSIIYRFPLDGSEPTEIMPGQIAFWSHR